MSQGQEAGSPYSSMTPQEQADMLKNYQFSREELKVLEQCNNESFYRRSLPLGTVMGLATYQGVRSGYLSGNSRFGAAPKMIGAIVVGYFIGKISYQKQCAEKLMALPGSFIGHVLRERKSGGTFGGSGFDTTPGLSAFGTTSTDVYSDVYKDAGPNSSLDLDTDRPIFKGLDNTFKPSLDSSSIGYGNEELPLPKTPGMSYDDLRKKNREENASGKQQPYKMERPPPISRPTPEPSRKNAYGDSYND